MNSEELHPPILRPCDFWACTEPERPHDAHTAYDSKCRWCMAKATIAVEQFGAGDQPMWSVGELKAAPLAELLREALANG